MADSDLDCAFIGSVVSAERFPSVVPDKADFITRDAGDVWGVIVDMHHAGAPLNFATIYTRLTEVGRADLSLWLNDLMSGAQNPVNTEYFAGQIIDRGARMKLRAALTDVIADPTLSFVGAVEKIEQSIGSLSSETWRGWRTIKSYAEEQLSKSESGGVIGVKTGIIRLDHALLGMRPGHLYLLGGRPSHGKTTLALQLSLKVAKTVPVLYMLLETSGEALAERMLGILGEIDSQQLLFSGGNSDDWKKVVSIMDGDQSITNLYVDTSTDLSTSNLRSRIMRASEQLRCGLVVVDYLQLMSAVGKDDRERVNKISRELVRASKDGSVPILALSQLTRTAVYEKPDLHHFKETGNLEADCDVAMMVYKHRPEFPSSMQDRVEAIRILENGGDHTDISWLEIMKNRQCGRLDAIPLIFDKRWGLFREVDE